MRSFETILLVEDDVVDAMTLKRALRDLNVENELVVKENGEEGLSYLRNPVSRTPSLIILDLNMPRMNGIEFLRTIKQDEILRRIPVVVLTTSQGEQDRLASFDLSVAGYMIKPVEYQEFLEVVKNINTYWTLSELPELQ